MENRCVDPAVGVKILSYDLLSGAEKEGLDAHLHVCKTCSDLRRQTYGKEGLLDEIVWRAFRLTRRQAVEPHAWLAARLQILWLPFLLLAVAIGVVWVVISMSGDPEAVKILRLAVSHSGQLDSLTIGLTPRIDPAPAGFYLRPDRAARFYVYETHAGAVRRLLPPANGVATEVVADSTSEILLPELRDPRARVLVVLVPADAPGTTGEWDAAVLTHLGGNSGGGANGPRWPERTRPTMRWLP